jgi:hypothetical protein
MSWHTPFSSSPLSTIAGAGSLNEQTPPASPVMAQPQWIGILSPQQQTTSTGFASPRLVKRMARRTRPKDGQLDGDSWVDMEVPQDDGFGLIGELYLCPFKVVLAITEELVYRFKFW